MKLLSKCINMQVVKQCSEVCNSCENVKIPIITSASLSNENKCANFGKEEMRLVSTRLLLLFVMFCT